MHLHTTSSTINSAFKRLLTKYSKFSFVSAWAGVDFEASKQVIAQLKRADYIVIGTHFYQTHPEFIRLTRQFKSVRFVLETDGVFHPKMYVFYNSPSEWSFLIGSANFTKGAFNKNSEVLMEVSSMDEGSNQALFEDAIKFITQCWKEASSVSYEGYLDYLEKWRSNQWHRNKLANEKDTDIEASMGLTNFQKLDWNQYINVLMEREESVEGRLKLLEHSAKQYDNENILGKWDLKDKLLIAGISGSGLTGIYKYWGHLGTTSRQYNFSTYLANPNSRVCRSIDAIPITGEVTKKQYDEFKKMFNSVYGKTSITSASRLLALKRPDTFYCYTSQNRKKFASKFNIAPTTVNLDTYWDKVVLKIRESNWYNTAQPSTPLEGRIAFAKAAILDAIFYH